MATAFMRASAKPRGDGRRDVAGQRARGAAPSRRSAGPRACAVAFPATATCASKARSRGDISLRGDLTIADGAKAASNVEAQAVTVGGELEGDVRAQGAVHLESGARVRGDIQGESVAIDDGAELDGRLLVEFELPPELDGTSGRRR